MKNPKLHKKGKQGKESREKSEGRREEETRIFPPPKSNDSG
jgi:hypothetical protein